MINLKGWRTEHLEIEIHESNLVKATIEFLRKKFKLTHVDGIDEKGRMYETVEYATSHSWLDKEDRGEPTAEQKKILEIITGLNEAVRAIIVP